MDFAGSLASMFSGQKPRTASLRRLSVVAVACGGMSQQPLVKTQSSYFPLDEAEYDLQSRRGGPHAVRKR